MAPSQRTVFLLKYTIIKWSKHPWMPQRNVYNFLWHSNMLSMFTESCWSVGVNNTSGSQRCPDRFSKVHKHENLVGFNFILSELLLFYSISGMILSFLQYWPNIKILLTKLLNRIMIKYKKTFQSTIVSNKILKACLPLSSLSPKSSFC
jgi:hypothetical protein